jgi:hypothetical protein
MSFSPFPNLSKNRFKQKPLGIRRRQCRRTYENTARVFG